MKTITEYIQKKKIEKHDITSSSDLQPGDYFRVEWEFNGVNFWVIAKFKQIGRIFNNQKDSVQYDFCISYSIRNTNPKIQINGQSSLENESKVVKNLTYKNATPEDVKLLQQVEDYIYGNNLENLIGKNTTRQIGEYVNGKLIFNELQQQ